MKIVNTINNEIIKEAVEIVNKHYKDEVFLRGIERVNSFNHTKDRSIYVADKIRDCSKTFYVVPYTHWNRFSSTLGHFKDPNYRVNMRKANALDLKERVKNIFHECCGHGNGYSHKGNYVTAYNLETVPYKAAHIFGEYLEELGIL